MLLNALLNALINFSVIIYTFVIYIPKHIKSINYTFAKNKTNVYVNEVRTYLFIFIYTNAVKLVLLVVKCIYGYIINTNSEITH